MQQYIHNGKKQFIAGNLVDSMEPVHNDTHNIGSRPRLIDYKTHQAFKVAVREWMAKREKLRIKE